MTIAAIIGAVAALIGAFAGLIKVIDKPGRTCNNPKHGNHSSKPKATG